MSIITMGIFAVLFGLITTLPLGPSGLSIVSSFGIRGTKQGLIALSALALAEGIYLSIALLLRHQGILELSNSIEVLFTFVFGIFLILFGSMTFRQSRKKIDSIPLGFRSIFGMSLMNPSLILSYLGLLILMDKSSGSIASSSTVIILSSILLFSSWGTLYILGKFAQLKRAFISQNMHTIKSIIGPLFIFVGLSTLVSTF